MVQDILASLRRRWQLRSLRDKILWPLVGLMLLSLLVSSLAFVFGTALTKNQLVTQQMDRAKTGCRQRLGAGQVTRMKRTTDEHGLTHTDKKSKISVDQ